MFYVSHNLGGKSHFNKKVIDGHKIFQILKKKKKKKKNQILCEKLYYGKNAALFVKPAFLDVFIFSSRIGLLKALVAMLENSKIRSANFIMNHARERSVLKVFCSKKYLYETD